MSEVAVAMVVELEWNITAGGVAYCESWKFDEKFLRQICLLIMKKKNKLM